MSKEIAAIIMLGLIDITAVVGFVFLAYHFNHWWIALFSILFTFSYEGGSKKDE